MDGYQMAWTDVTKTFTFRPFSVGHTTPMIDLPQMSAGGFLPTGMAPCKSYQGQGYTSRSSVKVTEVSIRAVVPNLIELFKIDCALIE